MRILKIIPDTVVDGPGLRTAIYFAGCKIHCKECHNKNTWDFNQGEEYYPIEVIEKIKQYGNDKITLTGGNPLDQDNLFFLQILCEELKKENYNIWLYTGYVWEDLIDPMFFGIKHKHTELMKILNNIDVLVDGPFNPELKEGEHLFRGSSNQRLIDVPNTLKSNKLVLL